MFGFGPLAEIVIIVSIHIQSLLFFCVYTNSCSPDGILVILSHLIRHVIGIFTHSCDYYVHFCGSGIGPGIVPDPHSFGFCGFCLGCVWLNIYHNFVNHGRLIIVSCPNIFSSVIGIVIFYFQFVHCIVCPVIVFFAWVIFPVIRVFMHISLNIIIVITIHSCKWKPVDATHRVRSHLCFRRGWQIQISRLLAPVLRRDPHIG